MQGEISELRSHSALARFECGCVALVEGYTERAYFWHRRFESHPVSACSHTACRAHRCGASGSDGQHRGECGPLPPERKPEAPVAPAPVAPAPRLRMPAPIADDDAPVWLPAEPVLAGSR